VQYTNEIKDDYTLADAFHAVGDRLYGPKWSGLEILGRTADDPAPILEQIEALQPKLDAADQASQTAQAKLKVAVKVSERRQANAKIEAHRHDFFALQAQEQALKEQLEDSQEQDHGEGVRYEEALDTLIGALAMGEIAVYCPNQFEVPQRFWQDEPDGFRFDVPLSLIVWPADYCARRLGSARLRRDQFLKWLYAVLPIEEYEAGQLSVEQQCAIWLKKEVINWNRRDTREYLKSVAMELFPGLSGRAFDRAWAKYASEDMKKPGAKTG
jgi:hypothetical protein